MHWFLRFPCLETLLASFGGVRVKSERLLVGAEGDMIRVSFWAGKSGLGEGEEEEESLREMGEMHSCFGGWN